MLGVCDATTIKTPSIEEQWSCLLLQAALPVSEEEYFAPTGPLPKNFECQRAFVRHYLRCKAILRRNGQKCAVYLKDCSRTGMGVISPIQMFPKERVLLWKDLERSFHLEIARCRKLGPSCYECGTVFVLKSVAVD